MQTVPQYWNQRLIHMIYLSKLEIKYTTYYTACNVKSGKSFFAFGKTHSLKWHYGQSVHDIDNEGVT